eukprot:500902_1
MVYHHLEVVCLVNGDRDVGLSANKGGIQLYVYIGGNSDKKSGGGGDKKSNGGGNRGSSWKITEISIISTLLLLVSCYLYLQQISHRIILVNIAVKIQNYG